MFIALLTLINIAVKYITYFMINMADSWTKSNNFYVLRLYMKWKWDSSLLSFFNYILLEQRFLMHLNENMWTILWNIKTIFTNEDRNKILQS